MARGPGVGYIKRIAATNQGEEMEEMPTVTTVYDQSADGKWFMSFTINGMNTEDQAIRAQELLLAYVCAGEISTSQKQ